MQSARAAVAAAATQGTHQIYMFAWYGRAFAFIVVCESVCMKRWARASSAAGWRGRFVATHRIYTRGTAISPSTFFESGEKKENSHGSASPFCTQCRACGSNFPHRPIQYVWCNWSGRISPISAFREFSHTEFCTYVFLDRKLVVRIVRCWFLLTNFSVVGNNLRRW